MARASLYPDGPGGKQGEQDGHSRLALLAWREAVDMPRMRVCSCIGCPAHPGSCPELSTARRCPDCSHQAEVRRGTRQQRGYTSQHDRLREQWKPKVEEGQVDCHAITCLLPTRRIHMGMTWDLGHTPDRTAWTGPEHQLCNRSAGGKAAHARS